MPNNEPMDDKSDDEWIETDPVDVRVSDGPRGRILTVPGDAPLSEVTRRAVVVARQVFDYRTVAVEWVNGWTTTVAGGLHKDRRHPDYREEVECE